MKRMRSIEGGVLLIVGLITLVEGLRLVEGGDPNAITDVLGPGYYDCFLGAILMITGVVHLAVSYAGVIKMKSDGLNSAIRIQGINRAALYMVLVFFLYIVLIDILGYLIPTLLFFLLEFWLAGVKSWKTNVALTLIVTFVFYAIFIRYCRIVFPDGLLFR
jgi:putative tricarboxylic transport membrane protein